jgi:hypothetical protein
MLDFTHKQISVVIELTADICFPGTNHEKAFLILFLKANNKIKLAITKIGLIMYLIIGGEIFLHP